MSKSASPALSDVFSDGASAASTDTAIITSTPTPSEHLVTADLPSIGANPAPIAPPAKPSRYFITATDTEVGKTTITAALLLRAQWLGLQAFGLKPITAGTQQHNMLEYSADARLIQHCSNVKLSTSLVSPILLPQAIAPHLAAQLCGRSLQVNRIVGLVRGALSTPAHVVLIEGAGGWRVPLNNRETMADVAKQLAVPCIVVVGIRLGCLNHAMLTVERIQMDGVAVAGWVANIVQPNSSGDELTEHVIQAQIDYLASHITAPLLGVVDYNPALVDWTIPADLNEQGWSQTTQYQQLQHIALHCLKFPPELK